MLQPGELWRWKINSSEHPNNPEHNIFLVLDSEWGDATKVLYLASGKIITYHNSSFTKNMEQLEQLQ